jgi:hypothetical protein
MWHAMEKRREVYKILVGNPKGKRLLRRPRRRWKDGIRMDLEKIGWGCGGLISFRIGAGVRLF